VRQPETGPADLRVSAVEGATEVAVTQGEVRIAAAGKEERVAQGSAAALSQQGFRRVSLLKAPTLEAPRAEARVRVGEVALTWAASPEAVRYRVQVAASATFRSLALDTEATETSATFSAQRPGAVWWRVAARDESGRQSPFSAPRRLFFEREPPTDALLEPPAGASYGFGDAPPRITFTWAPRTGARAYRLMIARSADLHASPVVSEVVEQPSLQIDRLQPGVWYWGVFVQGQEPEPLFLEARRLTVKKVRGSALVAPKRIRKWGE
jgi:hypothetical protein